MSDPQHLVTLEFAYHKFPWSDISLIWARGKGLMSCQLNEIIAVKTNY